MMTVEETRAKLSEILCGIGGRCYQVFLTQPRSKWTKPRVVVTVRSPDYPPKTLGTKDLHVVASYILKAEAARQREDDHHAQLRSAKVSCGDMVAEAISELGWATGYAGGNSGAARVEFSEYGIKVELKYTGITDKARLVKVMQALDEVAEKLG